MLRRHLFSQQSNWEMRKRFPPTTPVGSDLYPIDPATGLRIYNPEGQKVVDVDQLENADERTATKRERRDIVKPAVIPDTEV